ncbi:alkyl sulfatase C-terminal domain-containing protein [Pseudomonas moraviensis]
MSKKARKGLLPKVISYSARTQLSRRPTAANANATLTVTKDLFVQLLGGTAGLKEALTSDDLKVDGSKVDLVRFLGLLEKAPGNFAIVARTAN